VHPVYFGKDGNMNMECVHINPEYIVDFATPFVVLAVAVFLLLLIVSVTVIQTVIYCMIFHKAGYHWAFGLLMLVPIVCAIVPFVLAFGHWPIRRELVELRRQQQKPPV
jgi:hypothetical protein